MNLIELETHISRFTFDANTVGPEHDDYDPGHVACVPRNSGVLESWLR